MNTPCSVPLLESALAGILPKEEEANLHRHLEECVVCSAALEQMAGGPAWCQKAASLLIDDELDAVVPTRDEWSEVDFTVEHLEPADEPNVLGRLGGYDVLEIIGHGGMGVVLKGFDRELKRSVAIKVLAPHLARSSLARKRFAREAQAAAAVVHPHVLAIHQVQPGGRLPFLVMPLVAGESLAERLTAQGTLELKEILRIGMQAAAGLAAAHEQGLVHRDVKPANILLERGVERAVLTDFGLACAADDVTLTRWGIIAGTPQYMSPEQARGKPLDGRSDLFSLGCVLYEMATGVSPFRADSIMATMRRLVDDPPQAMASLNPELPPWFIAVVDRLLEKDPSRRFNSAQEVSQLLEGCLAHVQQPASVPLPVGLPQPHIRRGWRSNLSIKGVLTMIGTLAIGLLGVLLATANPPDIEGEWTGEDWGTVALKKISDTEYTGTYSDTVGKQSSASVAGGGSVSSGSLSYHDRLRRKGMLGGGTGSSGGTTSSSGSPSSPAGEIHLKWSRIERRFNGTWREGEDRFGDISVRLVGDEIRGALTTDPKSKINPATPRLADLAWRRVVLSKHSTNTLRLNETVHVAAPVTGMVAIDGVVYSAPPSSQDATGADRYLSVVGTMQPPKQVSHVWAETSGAVTAVFEAPIGQRVKKGDGLVQLDSPALKEDVETNLRLVRELQSRLASIKASPRQPAQEAIDIAKAELDKAHALAELARKDYESAVVNLREKTGAISQAEVDKASTTLAAREADEKIAKARFYALVEQPGRLQKEIQQTEEQLQEAQAALAKSRKLLAACTVRAPIDGIILSLDVKPDQFVLAKSEPGATEICQIADIHSFEIRAQLDSSDASQIDPGKDVEVRFDHPGTTGYWNGHIVGPDPEHVGNPAVVHVAYPDWRLYRAGGNVSLRFKLRAATPGGGTSVNPGGLPATNSGLMITDLNTGNTAIIDQPVTVNVQPKPGAAPAAILVAAISELQHAEVSVQRQKANFQGAEADLVRATGKLSRNKEERQELEEQYHRLIEEYGQKLVEKSLVDQAVDKLQFAQTTEQTARAELDSAQKKLEVAKHRLRRAEAELLAAQQKVENAKTRLGASPLPQGDCQENVSVSEMKKLQGTWLKVGEEFAGKPVAKENFRPQWWRFEGGRVTIYGIDLRMSEPEKSDYAYALGHAAAHELDGYPKTIVLVNGRRLEGPRTKSPGDVQGIYKIEGDTFTIAIGKKGLPKTLKTTEGDGVVVIVLKREGRTKEAPGPRSESSSPGSGSSSVSASRAPDKHALAIAEAELEKAQAAVELAKSNAERMAELAKERVVGKDLVDEAEAKVRMAEADEKVAQARLDALLERSRGEDRKNGGAAVPAGTGGASTTNPSPVPHFLVQQPTRREITPFEDFKGHIVADRKVQNGGEWEELEVSSGIGVRFEMDERTYLRYQQLMQAGKVKGVRDTFAAGVAGEENLPRSGKIARFEDRFNPNTGTIAVYGILPNPHGALLPGMFARVRLNLGPPRTVLEVPAQAVHHELGREHVSVVNGKNVVTRERGRDYVWLVNDKSIVERRFVRTGAREDGSRTQIIEEGLSPQDLVVVEGTEYDSE